MHRYAEGSLGNVGTKPLEFLIKLKMFHASLCWGNPRKCWKAMEFLQKANICHASLCRGHPGKCWKTIGSPYKSLSFSCIATPRDPSEMLTKTVKFLLKMNIAHASLCRGNPRKCWKSIGIPYKDQYFSCIACRGHPRNVEKPLEFTIQINILHALLCRGISRKCWRTQWNSL